MTCPIARILERRFAWLSTTPFGSPVLPDVYWMSAVEPVSVTRGSCTAGGSAARLAMLSTLFKVST